MYFITEDEQNGFRNRCDAFINRGLWGQVSLGYRRGDVARCLGSAWSPASPKTKTNCYKWLQMIITPYILNLCVLTYMFYICRVERCVSVWTLFGISWYAHTVFCFVSLVFWSRWKQILWSVSDGTSALDKYNEYGVWWLVLIILSKIFFCFS